jgi:hypothetical protein
MSLIFKSLRKTITLDHDQTVGHYQLVDGHHLELVISNTPDVEASQPERILRAEPSHSMMPPLLEHDDEQDDFKPMLKKMSRQQMMALATKLSLSLEMDSHLAMMTKLNAMMTTAQFKIELGANTTGSSDKPNDELGANTTGSSDKPNDETHKDDDNNSNDEPNDDDDDDSNSEGEESETGDITLNIKPIFNDRKGFQITLPQASHVYHVASMVSNKMKIKRKHLTLSFNDEALYFGSPLSEYNIVHDCTLTLSMSLAGGAPPQKRKVALIDMKAQDSDPDVLKTIFAQTSFNAMHFLDTLKNEGRIDAYLSSLERVKLVSAYVQVTVDHITELSSMKVNFSYQNIHI